MRKMVMGAAVLLTVASCADVLRIDEIVFEEGVGGSAQNVGGTTTTDGGSTSDGGNVSIGGAGGSGGGSPETCDNGLDDNEDGLTDCEDPLCGSYMCAPEVPSGWTGPFATHEAAAAAPCPSDAPTEILVAGSGSLTAPPATCTSCVCTLENATCSIRPVIYFNNLDCNDITEIHTPAQVGVCEHVTNGGGVESIAASGTASMPSGGSCTASGGTPTTEPPTFANELRVCAPSMLGAGCGTGSRCMPIPPAPFADKPCIMMPGDVACPSSGYLDKRLVYDDVVDSRGCASCGCSGAQTTCNAVSTVYEQDNCAGESFTVVHDGNFVCVDTGIDVDSVIFDYTVSGGCPETGGNPTGTATPSEPRTICCMP